MLNPPEEVGQLSADSVGWYRIKRILGSALDLGLEERDSFLSGACGEDSALRAEVERLLAHNDRSGGPLDRGFAPISHSGHLDNDNEEYGGEGGFIEGDLVCGRFRINRFIGQGGMGEVFEARDTVVNEDVAIKTIRPEIANQQGLVERLRREVLLSRQVSHTNVCRVFELWVHEGKGGTRTSFLTMELLKGETIGHRIKTRGAMRPKDALPLIQQIAMGLNEVHRAGIVHRDLKPSNLYLVRKPDGATRVVVTDFGLARPIDPEQFSRTQTGLAFGTPAYMAPEQFDTGEATFASDIYSFGVTIFEMITGRRAPLTLPSAVVDGLSPGWDEAVTKCLSRVVAERPANPLAVAAIIEHPARKRIGPGLWKPLAAATIAAAALGITYGVARPAPEPQYRLTNVTADEGLSWEPSISADGKAIAYSSDASRRGDLDIWVRRLDATAPVRVTDDPANDFSPSLSPDGSQVVYNSARSPQGIYIRDVKAGAPQRLLSPFGEEAAFSPDGKEITFWEGNDAQFTGKHSRIFVEDTRTGIARQLAADFMDARHPAWSEDGREILFEGCGPGCTDPETQRDWWRIGKTGQHAVATGALRTALQQGLALYLDAPVWRGGNIFFAARMTNDTNLWRIPQAAPGLGKWSGSPWKAVPIMNSTEEAIRPSASRDGSIAFAGLNSRVSMWLAPLGGNGETRRLSASAEIDRFPSISRDGKRIFYLRVVGTEARLVVKDIDGADVLNELVPASTRGMIDATGTAVFYTKTRGGTRDLYVRRGPAWKPALLRQDFGELLDISGTTALSASPAGIDKVDAESGKRTNILKNGTFVYDQATISPDGKWIVYLANRDAEHGQIFIAPLNGKADTGRAVAITDAGHWYDKPKWTADGKTVVYISDRDGFNCIWEQPVSGGASRAITHFHQMRVSPVHLSRMAFNLSVGRDSLIYNAGDLRSNVWIARP